MDTGERPAENIGSSVDPVKTNGKIETQPQVTEHAEETNGKNIVQSVNNAKESADSKNKPDEELFVDEKQVPSGTSVRSMDPEKHTCKALPQSGNAGEEDDVHIGSPVDHVKEPDTLKEAGDNYADTGKILYDLDPGTKQKSAISKKKDEDLETKSASSAPSVDPVVPLTNTVGIHGETSETSVNPGKGLVSCEDSKQKADTKATLPVEGEILSNTAVDTENKNVYPSNKEETHVEINGEKGDVSESSVDGANEASILSQEMKNEAEIDSDFKEKSNIGTKSTVDTEEKNVHSADKVETDVETSVQTIGTGGNPNVLPAKTELAAEATNQMPDLGTGLDVNTQERSGLKCVEHTSEAKVQSEKASEKCGVNLGSSVKSKEETAALLEEEEKTKEAAKSETSVGPIVPSIDPMNPKEEPGFLPVSSEDSEQKADTNDELHVKEEILRNPSAQSADQEENTSAVPEHLGNQGEKGGVSESPVDVAKEASISPVEEKKTGETDSDFKEKPDIGTESTVDTEEKKVHSADKEEMHDEISMHTTSTGGASNDLPMNEEIPDEATKEESDLRTESNLVIEEISSDATLHSASTAESYGEARVPTASDGEEPELPTDTRKDIDKQTSLPVHVEKPSENFEQSIDIVQPGHRDGPSVDTGLSRHSTEDMDQPKGSHKDDPNYIIRKRKPPSASQHTVPESLHPASDEKYEADHVENQSSARTLYSVAAGIVFLATGLYVYLLWESSPHAPPSSTVLQNYQYAFENLKKHFPGQNEALWLRSEKMHVKHLNKSQPLEPATIILTAARDGERTLRCLSEGLAKTYSSALKASYSVIDGSTQAKYESKDAKLQIDNTLSSGFSSTCRAAVLHRLEELPPGSVLILYKYCDHENAAFKNVALLFTVLLEVPTMDLDLSLRELEEKVKDVLWDRYLHTNDINSYDEMDVDKLSGVWSRISHLVLPVVPVESIESGSCPWQVVEQ